MDKPFNIWMSMREGGPRVGKRLLACGPIEFLPNLLAREGIGMHPALRKCEVAVKGEGSGNRAQNALSVLR